MWLVLLAIVFATALSRVVAERPAAVDWPELEEKLKDSSESVSRNVRWIAAQDGTLTAGFRSRTLFAAVPPQFVGAPALRELCLSALIHPRDLMFIDRPANLDPRLLISQLRDTDELARVIAIDRLGELKEPRAIEPLIELLKDGRTLFGGRGFVAGRAEAALEKITSQSFGLYYDKWRKWASDNKPR